MTLSSHSLHPYGAHLVCYLQKLREAIVNDRGHLVISSEASKYQMKKPKEFTVARPSLSWCFLEELGQLSMHKENEETV